MEELKQKIAQEYEGFEATFSTDESGDLIFVSLTPIEKSSEQPHDEVDGPAELVFRNKCAFKPVKNFIFDLKEGCIRLLGTDSKEAARSYANYGVNCFVSGDLKKSRENFKSAYKQAHVGSDEERLYEARMKVVEQVMEAESDLEKKRTSNYIYKIQNAFIGCEHEDMKFAIGTRRNRQAEKFAELAQALEKEGDLKEAEKLYKHAFEVSTQDSERKAAFKEKMHLTRAE